MQRNSNKIGKKYILHHLINNTQDDTATAFLHLWKSYKHISFHHDGKYNAFQISGTLFVTLVCFVLYALLVLSSLAIKFFLAPLTGFVMLSEGVYILGWGIECLLSYRPGELSTSYGTTLASRFLIFTMHWVKVPHRWWNRYRLK